MPAMHSLFGLLIAERKYGSCVRKWTKTGTTRQSGKLRNLGGFKNQEFWEEMKNLEFRVDRHKNKKQEIARVAK